MGTLVGEPGQGEDRETSPSTYVDFVRGLHSDLPPGYGVEIRPYPGPGVTQPVERVEEPPDLATSNYCCGVLPRRISNGVVDRAKLVWVDADYFADDPQAVVPKPTAIVLSGRTGTGDDGQPTRGVHFYWKLTDFVEPLVAVQLAQLGALALGGDHNVAEARRIMRLPGASKKPPAGEQRRPAVLVDADYERTYTAEALEEWLVALIVAPHFTMGQKHHVALSLGAVLARTGWTVERAVETMKHVIEVAGSTDPASKLASIRATYVRHASGEAVSAETLRDSMGRDDFVKLLKALGVSARDGDVIVDGEVIGKAVNLERDAVRYMMEADQWAYAEGRVIKWRPPIWELAEDTELASAVFGVLGGAKTIKQGDEIELPAKAGTAKAVAQMMIGTLQGRPVPETPAILLPLLNGTLNLTTLKLEPHRKEHYLRYLVPIEYDANARSPSWEKYLEETQPDEPIRRHLQEWLGYCMMPSNKWQRMLWLHGPEGTGKSTYLQAVGILLGPGYYALTGDHITEYSIAQLHGKRVAGCAELSPRMLKTSVIKALVAGDPLEARHVYGRPFSLSFGGKLVWASNELPPVDQGEGMYRRMVPIRFGKKIEKQDGDLWGRLHEEGAGILNWALEGLQRLLAMPSTNDWIIPASAQATVNEYRLASDTFARYVEEEIDFGVAKTSATLTLYGRYSVWAKERGLRVEPLGPKFMQELRRFGLEETGRVLPGLGREIKGGDLRPYNVGLTTPVTVSSN